MFGPINFMSVLVGSEKSKQPGIQTSLAQVNIVDSWVVNQMTVPHLVKVYHPVFISVIVTVYLVASCRSVENNGSASLVIAFVAIPNVDNPYPFCPI